MARRGVAVLVLLASFGAAAGGCAVADMGAFNRLQDDMVSLKREMAALRAAPPSSASHSAAAPAALPPGKGEAAEQAALRKAVADLRAETMGIRDELAATATRSEETRLSLQRDISHLNGKTDDQAQALAGVQGKLSSVDDLGRRLAGLEEKVGKLAAAEGAAPRPAPASAPVARDWKTPEDMYDYALGLVKSGETQKAREVLNAFAARYPEHRLLANVHYWRGESFYAEKDYENAILAFQDVVDKHPDSDKASDAMYKQGLAFLSLKDTKNARLLFELIRSKYPKSSAADKAAQKLSELK